MTSALYRLADYRQCLCLKQSRSHTHRTVCTARTSSAQHITASRRDLAVLSVASVVLLGIPAENAEASGRGAVLRKKVPLESYTISDLNGLKACDLLEGKGPAIQDGTKLVVHWDVLYRGINVVSSRLARTLGGNRTIAEPFEFVAGESVAFSSAAGGPQPPSALSRSVIGMKEGGIRSILVDNPKLGYAKRMQEIPPGENFELRIEVLDVKSV